jgi:CubicO group peptidase (beta-lactamase class C family)
LRVLVSFCVIGITAAQEPAAAVDKLLVAHTDSGDFSGAVLVEKNGIPILKKAYGKANLELQVPNYTKTKFRIGSITKQFTAAAILLLAERRKLTLQSKLCEFLDGCPVAWSLITVHQLLTHTSGIPEILSLEEFQKSLTLPSPPQMTARRLMKYPLAFRPGEKFNYSNSDYVLLALVIEKVAGVPYGQFLRENILGNFSMNSSGNDDSREILPDRALGYMKRNDKIINAEYIDMTLPTGSGSMYSTIEDMQRWKAVFTPGRLLSKQSLDAMLKSYIKADWGDGVGYGWFIGHDPHGHEFYAHLGGINGFAANVRYYPAEDLYVVVLSNRSFAPIDPITDEIVRAVIPQSD